MLIQLLAPGELLPDGGTGDLAQFEIVPVARQSWLAFSPTAGTCNFRSKLNTKGAGLTSLTLDIDHKPSFAGTASTISTLSNTSLVSSNTFMLPFLRLRQNGSTAGGDSDADIVLALGFPVASVRVLAARAGLPFSAGQDLADSARVIWS